MNILKSALVVVFIQFLLVFQLAGSVHSADQFLQWNDPLEKADLLLFSAHADDEHLFFAGVLPYCVANGIHAQVVYMTNHDDNPIRNTELIDGLWAVGIRNAPVIAPFPDLFSESLEEALSVYERRGFSNDDFVAYCVYNIRRFQPLVVVGHDLQGEYGHGFHSLSAAALVAAVELAGDEDYHSESAVLYGTWDVPKTYLNQWKERPIVLSIDEPLPFFGGQTAFQVSQYGFSYHKSQHWTFFHRWLNGTAQSPITMSTQIRNYPPGRYGLYRTLVGEDSEGASNFFENVVLIKDIPEEIPEPDLIDDAENEQGTNENPMEGSGPPLELLMPALAVFLIALLLLLYVRSSRKRK